MFHIYDDYSVLPKLNKIDTVDIFQHTRQNLDVLSQKKREYFVERGLDKEAHDGICKFIVENYPRPLIPSNIYSLSLQTVEDYVIHHVAESDWMAAGAVSFPSGWSPQKSIGRSLVSLHGPIPGIKLDNSRRMLRACLNGIYERFVWSVVYEPKLDYHPDKSHLSFDDSGAFWVKVERQVLVGFPELHAILFILRPYLIKSEDVDMDMLSQGLNSMTESQKKYKGVAEFIRTVEP